MVILDFKRIDSYSGTKTKAYVDFFYKLLYDFHAYFKRICTVYLAKVK